MCNEIFLLVAIYARYSPPRLDHETTTRRTSATLFPASVQGDARFVESVAFHAAVFTEKGLYADDHCGYVARALIKGCMH